MLNLKLLLDADLEGLIRKILLNKVVDVLGRSRNVGSLLRRDQLLEDILLLLKRFRCLNYILLMLGKHVSVT